MVYTQFISQLFFSVFNVATNGVASQISTSGDQEAQLALDDELDTCSKTNIRRGAWWKVDLGNERIITSITMASSEYADYCDK